MKLDTSGSTLLNCPKNNTGSFEKASVEGASVMEELVLENEKIEQVENESLPQVSEYMSKPIRVLLIADEKDDAVFVDKMLPNVGSSQFELQWADKFDTAVQCISTGEIDIILIFLPLKEKKCIEAVRKIADHGMDIPITVLSKIEDDEKALKLLRNGAQDYLIAHNITSKSLVRSIRYAIERQQVEEELYETNRKSEIKNKQLEESIEHANRMAVDTEVARAELNQIFNVAADGMCVIDKNFTLLRCNQTLLRLYGSKKSELEGKKCYEVFPEPYCHTKDCPMNKICSGEEKVEYEVEKIRGDGGSVNCILTATPFRGLGGELIGIVEAYTDITERKQAEEKLQETMTELERSNGELEQFAYIVSHDLQEPLRMVSSYCQLLEQRYTTKLDDDAKEFISFAVDGAQRMQGLIKDLLKFSRVGTRGKPFEQMELSTALDNALFNLKVAIEENNAEIMHDELPVAEVDSTQIVQLLQNLIGNALKFKRKDVTPKIHIGVVDKKSHWQISIKDNGIGIDPQFSERVFGIFQRLQTREDYPGTGIGLAVCKKIVERHGGRIWVESVLNEGATFYFTLPKNR